MKKRIVYSLSFLFIFSTALIAIGCGKETIATPYVAERFPVFNDGDESQNWPAISGDIVVCSYGNGLLGHNLATDIDFEVGSDEISRMMPHSISENIVVWPDHRNSEYSETDIYGYNIDSGIEFTICTNPYWQDFPAVSNDIVVWLDDRNGMRDIYGFNLTTSEEFPICIGTGNKSILISISNDIVVWDDERNGNFDIFGYNLSTATEFPICTNPAGQTFPTISGDIVIWLDSRNEYWSIYGYNLKTNTEFPIRIYPAELTFWADISDGIVVWSDNRNCTPGLGELDNIDIYGYNIAMGIEFPICTDPGSQLLPAISGDTVVWLDFRDMKTYGARLTFDNQ